MSYSCSYNSVKVNIFIFYKITSENFRGKYKTHMKIFKVLDIPRSSVRSTIKKWKEYGTCQSTKSRASSVGGDHLRPPWRSYMRHMGDLPLCHLSVLQSLDWWRTWATVVRGCIIFCTHSICHWEENKLLMGGVIFQLSQWRLIRKVHEVHIISADASEMFFLSPTLRAWGPPAGGMLQMQLHPSCTSSSRFQLVGVFQEKNKTCEFWCDPCRVFPQRPWWHTYVGCGENWRPFGEGNDVSSLKDL